MIDPHAERLALEEIQYLDTTFDGMDRRLQFVYTKHIVKHIDPC